MFSSMQIELLLVLLTFILTVVFAFMVYGVARELSLGIFRRFFNLLIAAALVSIAGRGAALMQLGRNQWPLPVGLETISGLLFFMILTAAFWILLRDWRKVSLEKPVRRGDSGAD